MEPSFKMYYHGALLQTVGGCNYEKLDFHCKRYIVYYKELLNLLRNNPRLVITIKNLNYLIGIGKMNLAIKVMTSLLMVLKGFLSKGSEVQLLLLEHQLMID